MVDVSSRRQAAARLEGMDVYGMLDLNGDGLIHQVVLARSLHIFDQSIFTQPVVQEILDSLVAKVPDRVDGRVPLEALVEHLAQTSSARSPPVEPLAQKSRPFEPLAQRSTPAAPLAQKPTPVESLAQPKSARSQKSDKSARSQSLPRSGERTPQSGERTPTVAEEISNSVDAYTDSLVCDIRGFKEVVNPEALVEAAGTSPSEIAELRAQLKAHAKQYVIDAQRRNICPLWDEFDKDGNGVLDPTECTALVGAYLHSMARKASEIIRGSVELGIELSLIISEKTVKDEATRQQMKTHARLQVEAIHANVAPLVQQMLDTMADEDPHTIAGELLTTIDLNRDGKVTRDEFEQRFVESMQYVLGPEGLMDKLAERNALR